MNLQDIFLTEQKVLPKVFYHGTPNKFEHFDLDFIGAKEAKDQDGPGFYFTDNIDTARGYAGKTGVILKCELFPRKIVKSTGKINFNMVNFMIKNAPDYQSTLENFDENPIKAFNDAIRLIVTPNNPKQTFEQIWYDFYRYEAKQWAINMSKFTYDAVLVNTQNGDTHIIMLNPDKIKIIERIAPLNEIELGGGVSSIDLEDKRNLDYKNKQQDLFPEIPTIEPNVPRGYQYVGNMGEYGIVKKKDTYDHYNYYGKIESTHNSFQYVFTHFGKPIGYVYVVENPPIASHLELSGKGLLIKQVYIEEDERGKNLDLKFYYWLLTHVCDYILPDTTHTEEGARLWRKLNQSRLFDMYVYDPRTGTSRKRWAGKDWNQIYNNDDLQPFLTLKGRYVDSDEYESEFDDN
jgi:hypothetical protein